VLLPQVARGRVVRRGGLRRKDRELYLILPPVVSKS
jgi:hypothetical protein